MVLNLEAILGFEPKQRESKSLVLPLHHIAIIEVYKNKKNLVVLIIVAYICFLMLKTITMENNSDLFFKLYKNQMERSMSLAQLFGSAISSMRVAYHMADDKFLKNYLDESIKELEKQFYGDKTESHES